MAYVDLKFATEGQMREMLAEAITNVANVRAMLQKNPHEYAESKNFQLVSEHAVKIMGIEAQAYDDLNARIPAAFTKNDAAELLCNASRIVPWSNDLNIAAKCS